MLNEFLPLSDLKPGQSATVAFVQAGSLIGQRLLEMGVTPSVSVRLIRFAPLGDPGEFRFGDTHLLLRKEETREIGVCHVR